MDTRTDLQRLLEDMDRMIRRKQQELTELDERLETARVSLSEREAQELLKQRGIEGDDDGDDGDVENVGDIVGQQQGKSRGRRRRIEWEEVEEYLKDQRSHYEQQIARLTDECVELEASNGRLSKLNDQLQMECEAARASSEKLKARVHILGESLEEAQSANFELNIRLAKAESESQMQQKLLMKSHEQDQVLMNAFNNKLESLKGAIAIRDEEIRRLRLDNQLTLESLGIRIDVTDSESCDSVEPDENADDGGAAAAVAATSFHAQTSDGLIDSSNKQRIIHIASLIRDKDGQIEMLKEQLIQLTRELEGNTSLLQRLTGAGQQQPGGEGEDKGEAAADLDEAQASLEAKCQMLESELEAKDKQLHRVEWRNRHLELVLPNRIIELLDALKCALERGQIDWGGNVARELKEAGGFDVAPPPVVVELNERLNELACRFESSQAMLDRVEQLQLAIKNKDGQIRRLVRELNELSAEINHDSIDFPANESDDDDEGASGQSANETIMSKERATGGEPRALSDEPNMDGPAPLELPATETATSGKQRAAQEDSARESETPMGMADDQHHRERSSRMVAERGPAEGQIGAHDRPLGERNAANDRASLEQRRPPQPQSSTAAVVSAAGGPTPSNIQPLSHNSTWPPPGTQAGEQSIGRDQERASNGGKRHSIKQQLAAASKRRPIGGGGQPVGISKFATKRRHAREEIGERANQHTMSRVGGGGGGGGGETGGSGERDGGRLAAAATGGERALERALDLQKRLGQLENENQLLELAMKEILLALKWSDTRCSALLIDCPSLERLCQLIEARFMAAGLAAGGQSRELHTGGPSRGARANLQQCMQAAADLSPTSGDLFQFVVLKSELDLMRGQNEQLRADLKLQRREYQEHLMAELGAAGTPARADTAAETNGTIVRKFNEVEIQTDETAVVARASDGTESQARTPETQAAKPCRKCPRLIELANHLLECIVRVENRVNASDETYISRLATLYQLTQRLGKDLTLRESLISKYQRDCHALAQQRLFMESKLALVEKRLELHSKSCPQMSAGQQLAAPKRQAHVFQVRRDERINVALAYGRGGGGEPATTLATTNQNVQLYTSTTASRGGGGEKGRGSREHDDDASQAILQHMFSLQQPQKRQQQRSSGQRSRQPKGDGNATDNEDDDDDDDDATRKRHQRGQRASKLTIGLLQSIIACLQARLDYKDERLNQLELLLTAGGAGEHG